MIPGPLKMIPGPLNIFPAKITESVSCPASWKSILEYKNSNFLSVISARRKFFETRLWSNGASFRSRGPKVHWDHMRAAKNWASASITEITIFFFRQKMIPATEWWKKKYFEFYVKKVYFVKKNFEPNCKPAFVCELILRYVSDMFDAFNV